MDQLGDDVEIIGYNRKRLIVQPLSDFKRRRAAIQCDDIAGLNVSECERRNLRFFVCMLDIRFFRRENAELITLS
ncbi:hypothetical protein D3C86_2125550 [compost metagenome]